MTMYDNDIYIYTVYFMYYEGMKNALPSIDFGIVTPYNNQGFVLTKLVGGIVSLMPVSTCFL